MTGEPESPRPDELRRVAVQSLGWSWAGTAAALVLQLSYAAIIARLVDPQQFGVIAGALLAMKFITYLARLGIGQAVIQRVTLDRAEASAAHRVSVVSGAIGMLIAVALAPIIGWVLNIPEAVLATRWLALGLLINGYAAVPEALLRRALAFKQLAIIQTLSYLISNLLVAVALAVAGFDLAALLASYLVGWIIAAAMMTHIAAPRPSLRAGRGLGGSFMRFGGIVSISSLLDVVSSSTDVVLVGRLGTATLGQYNRGTLLVGLPVEQASAAATRVAGPSLSRIQQDESRFAEALGIGVGLTAVFVWMPVAFAAAVAPSLVPVVLGPGWGTAALVLPAVATAHGLTLVTQVIVSGAESAGRVVARFWVQLASTLVNVAAIVAAFAVWRSALAVAIAWMVGEVVRLSLHSCLAVWLLHVDGRRLLHRFAAALASAILVSTPAFIIVRVSGLNGSLGLVISGLLALLVIAGGWLVVRSLPARQDLERLGVPSVVRDRLRQRGNRDDRVS